MTSITPSNGLTMDAVKQLFGAAGKTPRTPKPIEFPLPGQQAGLPAGSIAGPVDVPSPDEVPEITKKQEIEGHKESARGFAESNARAAIEATHYLNGFLGGFKLAPIPESNNPPGATLKAEFDEEGFAKNAIAHWSRVFTTATGQEPVIETASDGTRRVARTEVERTFSWGQGRGESYTTRLTVGGDEQPTYSIIDNMTGAGKKYTYQPGRGEHQPGRATILDMWA